MSDPLKRALHYDQITGQFYWRIRVGRGSRSRYPGDIAGTSRRGGYIQIGYANKLYPAHRLAWFFMTGAWPPRYLQIEHRDSNPSNNSWANLFAVPDAKNKQNLNDRLRKDNRSGCRGVSQRPDGRWHARITVDGRTILLGDYIDLEQAVMVRKNAERRYLDHDRLPLS